MEFSAEVFKKRIASQLALPSALTRKPVIPANTQKDLDDLLRIKDDREFLQAAYQRILGRACDVSGLVNYLEALSNHVPRRSILQALLDSGEAKAKPSVSPPPETLKRGFFYRIRARIMEVARELLKKVILVRFDSIDHKLTFLLQELTTRSDALSQKNDGALWTLSEKLDTYFATLGQVEETLRQGIEVQSQKVSDLATYLGNATSALEKLEFQARARETVFHDALRETEKRLSNLLEQYTTRIDEFAFEMSRGHSEALVRFGVLEQVNESLGRELSGSLDSLRVATRDSWRSQFEALSRLEERCDRLAIIEIQQEAVKSLIHTSTQNSNRNLENAIVRHEAQIDEATSQLEAQLRLIVSSFESAGATALEALGRQGDALSRLERHISQQIAEVSRRVYSPVLLGESENNVLVTEVEGFIVGVPSEEWRVAAHFAFRGVLEPGLTTVFKHIVRPGMIVVDVGANIGMYTLLGARLLEGRGKVHSFEPTPRISAILRNNVQVNGFLESGIIEFHESAVTDERGSARLVVFPKDSGHNTLFWDSDGVEAIRVPTISLDEALKHESHVDIVKIDAEGAEPKIIRGMRETILRNPSIRIALEFAPSHLMRAGVNPTEFLSELQGLGFEITLIDDQTGELKEVSPGELISGFSANLHLRLLSSAGDVS